MVPRACASASFPGGKTRSGGLTTLDGQWLFHLDDDMQWAAPGFNDSSWEKLAVDKPWGKRSHRSVDGYA